MHQDAHEFLNYILNTIAEDVQKYQKASEDSSSNSSKQTSIHSDQTDTSSTLKSTWVHQLFEGVFSNETKCLSCETVSLFWGEESI
jgi:ubiquitin C-terminal hydrolase